MLIAGGSTDVTTYFALRLAADGTAATGLTITGIDLQYVRSGVAPSAKADASELAETDSDHADNEAIEIDATDQPGLYRVDWPDAAFAAGVREVILSVKVATAFTEHLRVEIDGEVNTVEIGGTDVVLSGGLLDVNVASTDDIDLSATQKASVNTEVDTALDTSISELSVAAPTATPTVRTALMLMYMALRNKLVVQTSGTDALEVYNNAGTKIASKLLTDDGSDYTEAEMS